MRYLTADDARDFDAMAAFSELIGNNDPHLEKLSLLIREDGAYQGVAPACDILPMRYASLGDGVDPDLMPIKPKVGTVGAQPEVWARAANAAERFSVAAMKRGSPRPSVARDASAGPRESEVRRGDRARLVYFASGCAAPPSFRRSAAPK